MRRDEIRTMVKTAGLLATVGTVRDLLEGVTLDNGAKFHLKPEQFSLREIWEGFVGDVEDTLPSAQEDNLIAEEVNSTGFYATSRLLINSTVLAAFNTLPTVGASLVTNMPSNTRHETIAGFTEGEGLKDVDEGGEYQDSSFGEKYVTSVAAKKGRLIYITEEAVREDRTGQLLMRARRIGQRAAIDKEKTIINGVVDKFGTVFRPNGVPTALYSTANGNVMGTAGAAGGALFTTARPLIDWNDIDVVGQFHPISIKDDAQIGVQEPIIWNPTQLFVPNGKRSTALRIRNATEINQKTDSGNTRTTFTNPVAGQFDVISSVYVGASGLAGATADWYYGNFPEQFFWHDFMPIATFSMPPNSPEVWKRDIVAGFKVRYAGGVLATDFRNVIKVKAA